MKNKMLTYCLGVAVLIVWGLIIYRVVASASTDNDLSPLASKRITKEPYDDYTVPKDTTHLLLNYRDPFGLIIKKDTFRVSLHKRVTNGVISKPAINWDFIRYAGYVKNPNSKKLIAIIKINGRNVNMTEGETTDKVKLIRNLRDSVKVSFEGKTKFIVIHPENI